MIPMISRVEEIWAILIDEDENEQSLPETEQIE
jgi:hypothetical protein